ncbi:hypothetical protein EMIT0111MI5_10285 [Burkholderia sp. IT-111MI5]
MICPGFYDKNLPEKISAEGYAKHIITGQLIVPF